MVHFMNIYDMGVYKEVRKECAGNDWDSSEYKNLSSEQK